MFAFGETKTTVNYSKILMPKEFGLRRAGRKIYGVWKGDKILYLSDEIQVLEKKVQNNAVLQQLRLNLIKNQKYENKVKDDKDETSKSSMYYTNITFSIKGRRWS